MNIVLSLANGNEEEIPASSLLFVEATKPIEDSNVEGRVQFTLDQNTFYTRFIGDDIDELMTAVSHLRWANATAPDGSPIRFDPAYLVAILSLEDGKQQLVIGKGGALTHINVVETRAQLREAIDKVQADDIAAPNPSTMVVDHAPAKPGIRKKRKN